MKENILKQITCFFYQKVFYKKVLLAPVKNTQKIKKVLLNSVQIL